MFLGNEFIDDAVVFYCKRCDVRMQNKLQLEVFNFRSRFKDCCLIKISHLVGSHE